MMITANASNFRKNLYNTLEQVAKYNQVATINTKDGDVVLISADDYKNLMETMYLSSMPNVREDLLKAQKNPEQYSSLTVRVAGYTAYFTELAGELQNEIIARTTYDNV